MYFLLTLGFQVCQYLPVCDKSENTKQNYTGLEAYLAPRLPLSGPRGSHLSQDGSTGSSPRGLQLARGRMLAGPWDALAWLPDSGLTALG